MHKFFCILHCLQKKEINKILADIIKHMTPDRAFEEFYSQLQSVVSKILAHLHDFSMLFSIVSLMYYSCPLANIVMDSLFIFPLFLYHCY